MQVISGDAFAEIPKSPARAISSSANAWKRDYQKFFSMVFPRRDQGGLFLGHNVLNKRDEMEDFLKTNPHEPIGPHVDRCPLRRRHVGDAEAVIRTK